MHQNAALRGPQSRTPHFAQALVRGFRAVRYRNTQLQALERTKKYPFGASVFKTGAHL